MGSTGDGIKMTFRLKTGEILVAAAWKFWDAQKSVLDTFGSSECILNIFGETSTLSTLSQPSESSLEVMKEAVGEVQEKTIKFVAMINLGPRDE